jgi:hypothetical protein
MKDDKLSQTRAPAGTIAVGALTVWFTIKNEEKWVPVW